MSEQAGPQPLYVPVSNIRATTVAMLDDKGVYRTVLQMQWPYDRAETATQLCDALNALGVVLEIPNPGKKP